MEANDRRDRNPVDSSWVEGKLAKLTPDSEWQPDAARGLARFREECHAGALLRAGRGTGVPERLRLAVQLACICALAFLLFRGFFPRLWHSSGLGIVDIGQVSADVKALKDGQAAPDFVLKDSNGADVRLSSYKGRVVLLNFWATWCHGCKLEIPWIVEFQKKYKDRGFAVIGVAMDDDGWKSVKPYLAEKKLNYTVVIGNQEMAKPFGLDAMPMTFLIDRDGKIVATSVGIINRDACDRQIAELLASPNKSSGL